MREMPAKPWQQGENLSLFNEGVQVFNQGASMKTQRGNVAATLYFLIVGFLLAGVIGGWIWNVVKIVQSGFEIWNGMLIARCIGVFVAPLGSVLGWF